MFHSTLIIHCYRNELANKGLPRTFGSLVDDFTKFMEAGGDTKTAKHYGNVTNMPMFQTERATRIIDLLPLPELHLLLGGGNSLFSCKLLKIVFM